VLKRETFVVSGFQTTNSLISGLGIQPRRNNARVIFPGSKENSKIYTFSFFIFFYFSFILATYYRVRSLLLNDGIASNYD